MPQPDFSPSAERNKQPILDVLQQVLPDRGTALEIASGTGQHVAWFARQLPLWTWQPTEAQHEALRNIEAWVAQAGLDNVLGPMQLDVCSEPWFADAATTPAFDLIFCANMLHIAPWEATLALLRGSARRLAPGGKLVTYGPYFENNLPPAPTNVAFDQSLRERDASWGIRQRQDVEQAAAHAGLRLHARHAMPANNLLLVWTARA